MYLKYVIVWKYMYLQVKKLFAGFTKCGYRQRFIRGFTNPQIPIKIQVPREAQISYAGPRCHESGLYTTWGGTNAVSPKISQQEQARGHLPQRGGWGLYQIEWLVMKCITEIVYVRVALPRKHHQLENNNSIINSLYRIRIMKKFVEYVLTVFELQWLHFIKMLFIAIGNSDWCFRWSEPGGCPRDCPARVSSSITTPSGRQTASVPPTEATGPHAPSCVWCASRRHSKTRWSGEESGGMVCESHDLRIFSFLYIKNLWMQAVQ